jgi:nicotinamidase-related amidase
MSLATFGALILVDLQQDFLARPNLEPHPDSVVGEAARWLAAFRAAGRPVAHVLTRVRREPDQRMVHWKKAGLWACEQGTPGERPPDCLAPVEGEAIFHKHGFLPSNLAEVCAWARSAGGNRVVLAGVMSHACVAHLSAAFLSEGFEVAHAAGAVGSDRPQAAAQ